MLDWWLSELHISKELFSQITLEDDIKCPTETIGQLTSHQW